MKTLIHGAINLRLYRLGSYLMARYVAVADDIAGGDIHYAERVCPSLKFLRRRARACARLINRRKHRKP